jgi:hypothetical protein
MRGKLREQAIKVLAVDRPRTVTVRAWNFCLWIPGRGTALTVRKPLALWCQVGPYTLAKGATDCSQPADSQVTHHRGHAGDPF